MQSGSSWSLPPLLAGSLIDKLSYPQLSVMEEIYLILVACFRLLQETLQPSNPGNQSSFLTIQCIMEYGFLLSSKNRDLKHSFYIVSSSARRLARS